MARRQLLCGGKSVRFRAATPGHLVAPGRQHSQEGVLGKQFSLTSADKFQLGAYRADPSGPAKGGIVVIQEIFGVNHHIRAVCDRLASEGYAAVAPALFDRQQKSFESGYTPDEIANARKFVANPDWGAMLRDTQAAIDDVKKDLKTKPGTRPHSRPHLVPPRRKREPTPTASGIWVPAFAGTTVGCSALRRLRHLIGDADRAAHAGAAQAAIAHRVLRQILLVIVLGKIERRRIEDFGGDRIEAPRFELLLVHRFRL